MVLKRYAFGYRRRDNRGYVMQSGKVSRLIAVAMAGALLLGGCGSAGTAPAVSKAETAESAGAATEESSAQASGSGSADAAAAAGTEADGSDTAVSTEDASAEDTADGETASDSEPASDDGNAEDKEQADITSTKEESDMAEQYPLPESETLDFVSKMKIGWNLGNTMDAWIAGTSPDDLSTETSWQHEKTTPELIKAVHEAGFETLRIPVSWHDHVTDDVTISPAWMARVKEIVDYGIDEGMYVIINIHHDNNPEFNAVYPDSDHLEQSKHYVQRIWEQVAETFKDYDEHLLFEGLNEPRLIGTGIEWQVQYGNKQSDDAVKCINELNQTFVDTVRASGGNNSTRYLLVPGYCGSPEGLTSPHFVRPTDPGPKDRVMLECHSYRPYHFALEPNGASHYGLPDSNPKEMTDVFDMMYKKYTSQGIGVLIDEFGAVNRDGNVDDRVRFYEDYIAGAKAVGITCCVWDNGYMSSGDEIFGLFDRKTYDVDQKIIDALMKAFQ